MRETSRWSTRVKNYDTHETIVYILSLFGKPMFVWYGARLPFNGHTFSNVCANTTISQISFESIQHSYIFDYFLLFISSTLEVYYLDFIHFSSQCKRFFDSIENLLHIRKHEHAIMIQRFFIFQNITNLLLLYTFHINFFALNSDHSILLFNAFMSQE